MGEEELLSQRKLGMPAQAGELSAPACFTYPSVHKIRGMTTAVHLILSLTCVGTD